MDLNQQENRESNNSISCQHVSGGRRGIKVTEWKLQSQKWKTDKNVD